MRSNRDDGAVVLARTESFAIVVGRPLDEGDSGKDGPVMENREELPTQHFYQVRRGQRGGHAATWSRDRLSQPGDSIEDGGLAVTQVFFIPGPLPGMNDYISTGNRFVYNRDKKRWEAHIEAYVRQAKIKPIQSVYLHFVWSECHKLRDPDNFSSLGKKFILDSLVRCGVLPDDGWKQIVGWSDTWIMDKSKPGVLVTLEERGIE